MLDIIGFIFLLLENERLFKYKLSKCKKINFICFATGLIATYFISFAFYLKSDYTFGLIYLQIALIIWIIITLGFLFNESVVFKSLNEQIFKRREADEIIMALNMKVILEETKQGNLMSIHKLLFEAEKLKKAISKLTSVYKKFLDEISKLIGGYSYLPTKIGLFCFKKSIFQLFIVGPSEEKKRIIDKSIKCLNRIRKL